MPVKNLVLLLICAFIWGTSFTGQAIGMEFVPPFTFTAGRSILGMAFLLPLLLFSGFKKKKGGGSQRGENRILLVGGFLCGAALFAGESFQQFALLHTSVGKAGFITSLYIVIVPVMGVALGKRGRMSLWLAVATATVGLYFLSVLEDCSIGLGDILCAFCAFCYSVQIMLIDRYAPMVDTLKLTFVMFGTGSALGFLATAALGSGVTWEMVKLALPAMLYVGIFSNGIAYTLQVAGQKNANPTVASLVMSLESVFAALCGWVWLGQSLSERELLGCVLVGTAVVMAQVPDPRELFKKRA